MITDDDIRAAFDRVVARAPDPLRVRRVLAGRARRHRQRRVLVTAGGAAMAVGALGVPGWLAFTPRAGSTISEPAEEADWPPVPNVDPPVPDPPPGPGNGWVAMPIRPTWLPDGFVEVTRRMWTTPGIAPPEIGPAMTRVWIHKTNLSTWLDGDRPVAPCIFLQAEGTGALDGTERPATVNGRPATMSTSPTTAEVRWRSDGRDMSVSASRMPNARRVALRVARSLVPDGVAGIELAIGFGWLPDHVRGGQLATIEHRGSGLRRALDVAGTGTTSLGVELGPGVDLPRGTIVMFRGRAGVLGPDRGARFAGVRLDDDLVLGLSAGETASTEEIVRILDELRIGPDPYLGWVGRR